MFRYLGLIWHPSNISASLQAEYASAILMQDSMWQRVLQSPGLTVLCRTDPTRTDSVVHRLSKEAGVVVGNVFVASGDQTKPAEMQLDDCVSRSIMLSRGATLFEQFWGRYVALGASAEGSSAWVIKDPTGRMPCFWSRNAELAVVFSYFPDWLKVRSIVGHAVGLNERFLAARLALGSANSQDTGVIGVAEVCGGQRVEFSSQGASSELVWDCVLRKQDYVEDSAKAGALLNETIRNCTSQWAAHYSSILHRLSGGLDSSIVLTCLHNSPSNPAVTCLTLYRQEGVSDERPWARLVARDRCARHVEYSRTASLSLMRLIQMVAAPSPPMNTSFLEADELERELAETFGIQSVCSGDGGDGLFGSNAARFALLDFVKRRGVRPKLLQLASDVALLHDQTAWRVIWRSLRRAFHPDDSVEDGALRQARALVAAAVREPLIASRGNVEHPWFRSGSIAPSRKDLLSTLTLPDLFYSPFTHADRGGLETIYPLMSQPVVELCLRIPADVLFLNGIDRGLVRSAFAGEVPVPILERVWKDRVQGFPEEIVRTNHEAIRELLLGGLLIQGKYLDVAATESALSGLLTRGTVSAGEILDHCIVEGWLRSLSIVQ